MSFTVSGVSRIILFFNLALSGCVATTGDDFVADSECSLTLRTSGAVAGDVREVYGCFGGGMIVTEAGQTDVEITMGARPRDRHPFEYVELAFYELLGDTGEGTAVTVLLSIDEARKWRTPDGSCTADYESEACTTTGVEDGVRYIVTALDCTEPAQSETEAPVAIDQLSFTSSCGSRGPD